MELWSMWCKNNKKAENVFSMWNLSKLGRRKYNWLTNKG